ncbi:hypothetical protein ABZ070_12375 [Streptomyces sp. NPDC006283]|uniref:hypothetical protein n=1 Tax=Streptomyces sp. NPDC006283 TaxID=3156741 RepID=UPI00339E61F1
MEMTEDEYQALAELDRIRSGNPVLDAWLQIQQREFPAWAQDRDGDWDFTPDSHENMETLVRSRCTSSDQAWQERGSDFLQAAAWYVGEVHNRVCGTQWQYHPDSATADPTVWPFVTVPFDRVFGFEDEDGIESDARPLYTPVSRLCGILDADGGSLVADLDVHTPPQ